jgi:hypothetical protein
MEIIGYICVGIIVLYILVFIRNLFSNDNTITIDELSYDVMKWFVHRHPIRKTSPRIIISNEKSDYNGIYSHYNNSITLYISNTNDYEGIVSVILHEMVHWYLITSKSKDELYDKQLKEYGYDNHPQEIWCRTLATKLTKIYIKEHS